MSTKISGVINRSGMFRTRFEKPETGAKFLQKVSDPENYSVHFIYDSVGYIVPASVYLEWVKDKDTSKIAKYRVSR